MNKPYDLAVFIGRLQGLHSPHASLIERASQLSDKVLVIIGSADRPRTFKNPFTTEERRQMVMALAPSIESQLVTDHVYDNTYNDTAWAAHVQKVVSKHIPLKWSDRPKKVALVGHKKDETSFYLDMFPQWDYIDQKSIEPLSASQIRELYFCNSVNMNFIRGVVPESTFLFLEKFKETSEYQQIIREREFIETNKKQYEHLKYGIIFQTVDAIVVQSGHVLMIKRRAEPGKGLWAFPGGYLDAKKDRTVEDGMIRELFEETGIKVPEKVLRGSITKRKRYDAINRSERGRIITDAFKIELEDSQPLPRVRGADDAEKAKWIPIAEIRRDQCFEDHYEILQDMKVGVA